MENYNPITLKGNVFYKSIKSISFNPIIKVEEMKVAVPRGKWFFWKFLGLIPLIPKRAKEDLYKIDWCESGCRFQPINIAYEFHYGHMFDCFLNKKEKTVYREASVDIFCFDGKNIHTHFKSNQEAKKYFDDVKNKCKECGNDLK